MIFRNVESDALTKILLGEVIELNIQMQIGLMVSTIYVWQITGIPTQSRIPQTSWEQLLSPRMNKTDIKPSIENIELNEKGAVFFQLESSYGGSMLAIGRGIVVEQLRG